MPDGQVYQRKSYDCCGNNNSISGQNVGAQVSNSRTLEAETGGLLLGYTVSSRPDCTNNETLSQDSKREQERGTDRAGSVGGAFVKHAQCPSSIPSTH